VLIRLNCCCHCLPITTLVYSAMIRIWTTPKLFGRILQTLNDHYAHDRFVNINISYFLTFRAIVCDGDSRPVLSLRDQPIMWVSEQMAVTGNAALCCKTTWRYDTISAGVLNEPQPESMNDQGLHRYNLHLMNRSGMRTLRYRSLAGITLRSPSRSQTGIILMEDLTFTAWIECPVCLPRDRRL
jgi:hypothetical protein